jgi:hypothetical protein
LLLLKWVVHEPKKTLKASKVETKDFSYRTEF